MEKNTHYLRQVIVVDKSLHMPTGKLAAMVAHASMTFITDRLATWVDNKPGWKHNFWPDEIQWLTELDPGLEDVGQLSFAKIVCAADSRGHLLEIEQNAKAHTLQVHRVVDCGYSHNKFGDIAAIAIGPAWPEQLQPVTGGLKIYREKSYKEQEMEKTGEISVDRTPPEQPTKKIMEKEAVDPRDKLAEEHTTSRLIREAEDKKP